MPLVIDAAWVERVKNEMPELPVAIQQRFVTQYGLTPYDANVLTSSKAMAAYYEAVVLKVGPANAKVAANWLMGEVSSQLNREGLDIAQSPVSSAQLALLLQRIADGTISNKIAKEIFVAIWEEKATDEAAADRVILFLHQQLAVFVESLKTHAVRMHDARTRRTRHQLAEEAQLFALVEFDRVLAEQHQLLRFANRLQARLDHVLDGGVDAGIEGVGEENEQCGIEDRKRP